MTTTNKAKACTAEDVYYLYERNTRYYYNCQFNGKTCPNEDVGCYCHVWEAPVLPMTIGEQFVPCDFKRKVYIKPGEECAICLETIQQKSKAYLTSCGHSFHKLCAFKAYDSKISSRHTFSCPLCRARLGYPEFYCRYTSTITQNKKNKCYNIDALEDFWLSKDFISVQICRNGNNHDLGMKNECYACLNYRESGF
jgi:hypothetical protein